MSDFLGTLYAWISFVPKITKTNVLEIVILAFVIYEIMVWINGMQTNVVWILLAIGAIASIALYAVSVTVLFREMRYYEVKA